MDLSNSLADLSKGESEEQGGGGDGDEQEKCRAGAGARVAAIFVGHLGGFVHFHKQPTMFKGEYHEYTYTSTSF